LYTSRQLMSFAMINVTVIIVGSSLFTFAGEEKTS